ncbi:YhgE/Pip family protein [Paenibacillus sp. GCM10027626]|uniref:YhgE/Pip domain-containing protein n=1 Tax=Paenibacillus sp. GCM10027626 TaxID=3273411 RepID=UPI0036430CEB
MKNILHIFKTDLVNIGKNPTGLLLMIALAFLPSIYAWINLEAMWDPYKNTSGIKIAVTSQDEGTEIKGKSFNIGDEVVESLRKNTNLGWTFVSAEEARRGLEHGDYYASLLIPADFSRNIASVIEGNIQKPEIEYTVNEKLNAVAPKITEKGASSVSSQISQNFIKTVSETVLARMKEEGLQIERQLPTLRKMEARILELESRLPEIEEIGDKALDLEAKWPDIRKQTDKILTLETMIPEINKAGDTILKIEERWPLVMEAAQEVLVIQKKMPEIQQTAERVKELDKNYDAIEKALDKAIADAKAAHDIVGTALETLPKLETIAATGGAFADDMQQYLHNTGAAFDSLIPVMKQNVILIMQTADAVQQITSLLKNADIDPEPVLKAMDVLANRLSKAQQALERMIGLLTTLNNHLPNGGLSSKIDQLNKINTNLKGQISTINKISQAIRQGQQPAETLVNNLNTLSKDAMLMLANFLNTFDNEITPAVNKALDQLLTISEQSSDVLQKLQAKFPDIKQILLDAQSGIDYAQSGLDKVQKGLPEARARLHAAAQTIDTKMKAFTDALNKAAPFVKNDLPKVESKVHEAATFVRNDLPTAEQQLHKVADLYKTKLPEVEKAIHDVASLVRNEMPEFEQAVHKTADRIRELSKGESLDMLLKLLKTDIEKESDFLASPVSINEHRLYPIPNYGSAMSPFYTTLSLWVGAMLLISMLRVEPEAAEGRTYKSYEIYFGRLCIFLVIGIFQAIIVTSGDLLLLGTYVANKVWFIVFAILIGSVFITITYTLVSVFGNIGKGLAIIFLVLQFSSSGGTFPITMTSTFFQTLNPFMPFTYAVGLMREAVGGINWGIVWKDVMYLFIFIGICYVVALALKKPLSSYTKRVAEKAERTKLIS